MALAAGLAVASLGLEALGKVLGFGAQQELARKNEAAAKASAATSIAAINERIAQERQATAAGIAKTREQAFATVGSAQLQAAEAGVSGQSYDVLLDQIVASAYEAIDTQRLNQENTEKQLTRQKAGVAADAQNRINQVQAPSALGLGLDLFNSTLRLESIFPKPPLSADKEAVPSGS